jgi:hypothetical protein
MNGPDERVTIIEIADLTAWLRRLSTAGPGASDPAELAAFHTAKADLLAHIHNQHNQHDQHIQATPRPNDPGKDIR